MQREERIAKNQVLFREVNERIEEAAQSAAFDGPTIFVCECGDEDCAEPLELSLDEYEDVRARPTCFAVRPGHEMEEIERIIAKGGHFSVVEKIDRAGEIASENDPRSE